MKIKWLNRRMSIEGHYLCLCLSEDEYRQVLKEIKYKFVDSWVSKNANATTHFIEAENGTVVIVCLTESKSRLPIETAGILVHEAVHIWQDWCEYYGEKHPGIEQEAYAIQAISQELMVEYARRLKEKNT